MKRILAVLFLAQISVVTNAQQMYYSKLNDPLRNRIISGFKEFQERKIKSIYFALDAWGLDSTKSSVSHVIELSRDLGECLGYDLLWANRLSERNSITCASINFRKAPVFVLFQGYSVDGKWILKDMSAIESLNELLALSPKENNRAIGNFDRERQEYLNIMGAIEEQMAELTRILRKTAATDTSQSP